MKKAVKISIVLWLSIGMLVSCSKKDDDVVINDPTDQGGGDQGGGDTNDQTDPPITLDCNYFKESRTLTNNPKAKVDYIITCVMPVSGDIVIEPGVVIEFEQNAGISLSDFNNNIASISAKGTADKPIIFRGVIKDKGYWRGIYFGSNNPKNELDYVHIEDAGGREFNSNGDKGAIVFTGGVLKMFNSIISNSLTYGLSAVYGGSTLEIESTKFKNNNAPIIILPKFINSISKTNDYSGNTEDFVYVESGSFSTGTTWEKINVPYVVLNRSAYNYTGGIGVKAVLTVEAGAEIEFDANTKLTISEYGAIKAIGTVSDPILFTAVHKVAGAWNGIYFNSKHVLNEIAFAEFHYSGGSTGNGSIELWYGGVLNIHDVTFKNMKGCALVEGITYGQTHNPGFTYTNITIDQGACLWRCYGQGCNP